MPVPETKSSFSFAIFLFFLLVAAGIIAYFWFPNTFFNPVAAGEDSISQAQPTLACNSLEGIAKEDCVFKKALELNKPSLCQDLSPSKKSSCYSQVFRKNSKSLASDCDYVLKKNVPAECFMVAAIVFKDSSLCKTRECRLLVK